MFQNLKVVELASVLAGPAAGMFFAELGAKVIKVENKKTGGDVTRTWKLPSEDADKNVSAYFSSVNWGKEHLFLDYTNESDFKKVLELLREADLVICNFKPGDAQKLKLDYTAVTAINPTIIYGSISGFGENDARPAFDVVLQAESGFMSMNGTPDSGPLKMPVALIDVLAAHQLKEALLLALLKKEKTGKGSEVTVSLYHTAVSSLVNQASNYLMNNHIPQRIGSLHPNIAPYGETFITSDKKFIVLAVGNDEQFKKCCLVLGQPTLALNEKYISNSLRVKNRKQLFDELQPLFFAFRRDELMSLFHKDKIPAGAVLNLEEVFSNEEAKKSILEEQREDVLTKRVKSISFNTDFLK